MDVGDDVVVKNEVNWGGQIVSHKWRWYACLCVVSRDATASGAPAVENDDSFRSFVKVINNLTSLLHSTPPKFIAHPSTDK